MQGRLVFALALLFIVSVHGAAFHPAFTFGTDEGWHSWNGRQKCHPKVTYAPANADEVAKIVRKVYENVQSGDKGAAPIKVHGAGHSFSPAALSDGTLMTLDNMQQILKVDGVHVTVQAGIRLKFLNEKLWALGLAMKNLGAIGEQSIAGATQTGTHGTGEKLGNLATQIVAMKIVDGRGQVISASATENKNIFDAARVGIGALGIVVEVTLETRPVYKLRKSVTNFKLTHMLNDVVPELRKTHERLQYFWEPYTEDGSVLMFDPTDDDITGCWESSSNDSSCVDASYKALSHNVTPQTPIYTEMEYFVDAKHELAYVNDFIDYLKSIDHKPSVKTFAGVRFVAGDDILLSQCHGRDTIVLSVIAYGDADDEGATKEFQLLSSGAEKLAAKYDGRPHWGKMHSVGNDYIRSVYPDTFNAYDKVRRLMDPENIFVNDFVQSRLVSSATPSFI